MARRLLWLVRNDFLPFAYASARSAPSRGLLDHVVHPVVFAAGQVGFLLPSLLIAAALAGHGPKPMKQRWRASPPKPMTSIGVS